MWDFFCFFGSNDFDLVFAIVVEYSEHWIRQVLSSASVEYSIDSERYFLGICIDFYLNLVAIFEICAIFSGEFVVLATVVSTKSIHISVDLAQVWVLGVFVEKAENKSTLVAVDFEEFQIVCNFAFDYIGILVEVSPAWVWPFFAENIFL